MKYIFLLTLGSLIVTLSSGCITQNTSETKIYESNTLLIEERIVLVTDARGTSREVKLLDLYHYFYRRASDSGIIVYGWDDANEIDPEYLIEYFSAQTNWSATRYDTIYMPAEYVETYLSHYFDVNAEHLRTSEYYNPQDGTYKLPDQPHGYHDTITGASMDGSVLTITYEPPPPLTSDGKTARKAGKLQIYIDSYPHVFKYISNEIIDVEEE